MKPLKNTVVHLPKKHFCPWHGVHIYFNCVQNGFGCYTDRFYVCDVCTDERGIYVTSE